MGDTVNLAARLTAKAPYGSVLAGPGVLEHSETAFETDALEPFSVKGKSKPVAALRVGTIRRSGKLGSVRRRLPLIGRDQEMSTLAGLLAQAKRGSGSLAELVGETGSGKSRLLTEARELAEGMRVIHSSCDVYGQATPYAAWRNPLRQLLGCKWEDSSEAVLARLRTQLEASQAHLLPWLPLLAIVFDADAPTTREVEELAPSARVDKLHEVVLSFLEVELGVPTLVQIEHAHLMDGASVALLHALAARIGGTTWLVLTTRREVEQGFVASGSEQSRLELAPLGKAELMEIAETAPESHVVPPHLLELAIERSGGSWVDL